MNPTLTKVINATVPFAITCLDTWNEKLLLGTQNMGVIVYSTNTSSSDAMTLDYVVHKELVHAGEIKQLNVIDHNNMVIILSGGRVKAYNISLFNPGYKYVDFKCLQQFKHERVEQYSLYLEGATPRMSIASIGKIYVYLINGHYFILTHEIDFSEQVHSMVLTNSRLYISYLLHKSSVSVIYYLHENTFSNKFNKGKKCLARYFGQEQVLFHHENTSTIFENDIRVHQLNWTITPTSIAVMENCCIGIKGKAIEIVPKEAAGSCVLDAEGDLQFITDKQGVYVASSAAIWHLVLHSKPLPTSLSSFVFAARDSVHISFVEGDCKEKSEITPSFSPGDLVPERDIKLEDPLEVFGVSEQHIAYLGRSLIFTIRHFALIPKSKLEIFSFCDEALLSKHAEAVSLLQKLRIPNQEITPGDVYGYLYPTDEEFACSVEARCLKSPYVYFSEYVESTPEKRANHPWKDIYQYYKDAVLWNVLKGVGTPSDTDVFSYLCWKNVSSIAKHDTTAGARAIFFYFNRLHYFEGRAFLSKQDSKRNNPIRLNLTALCNNYKGILFNKEVNSWRQVTMEQHQANVKRMQSEERVNIPLGCIVTPTGTIEWDCLLVVSK